MKIKGALQTLLMNTTIALVKTTIIVVCVPLYVFDGIRRHVCVSKKDKNDE